MKKEKKGETALLWCGGKKKKAFCSGADRAWGELRTLDWEKKCGRRLNQSSQTEEGSKICPVPFDWKYTNFMPGGGEMFGRGDGPA